ncbi:MAG: glycosyltransferase, partial [Vulcanimicrobiaceae bacterium]
MKLLWLTLADPDPPTNGQFVYSAGLIEATLSAGGEIEVVAFDRPEAQHRDGYRSERIAWSLAAHRPRPRWLGLAARTPFLAFRTMTSDLRHRASAAIVRADWDAVVFDSLALGWALPIVLRIYRNATARPRIVYIAHNHETEIARIFARDETRALHRLVKRIDALRVARLERTLVDSADLVTANTPEDCGRFDRMRAAGETMFLPPGYGGRRTDVRKIDTALPRRAVIVGSFDWPPKRESLEAFLAVADGQFAAARIELLVVGNAEAGYLDRLRRTTTATRFTGRVDDIRPYLREARLALVPDTLGGFKLKTLDY